MNYGLCTFFHSALQPLNFKINFDKKGEGVARDRNTFLKTLPFFTNTGTPVASFSVSFKRDGGDHQANRSCIRLSISQRSLSHRDRDRNRSKIRRDRRDRGREYQ